MKWRVPRIFFSRESLADEMLKDFNSICKSLQIPWWVIAATALGFYRDGGYIPWDNDIDIGIICTDDEYTEIFKRLFGLYGFEMLYDARTGPDFRYGVGHAYRGGETRFDSLFLDIFRIGVESFRCITPKFFEVTKWFKYKGMSECIRLPFPIEDYLCFMYGDAWSAPQAELKQWRNFINRVDSTAQVIKDMAKWRMWY